MRKPSPWTLCTVGHAAVDHCFDIDHFPAHRPRRPHTATAISGGMAANASIAAMRLGATVRLHGAIGDDDAGDFLVGRLGETAWTAGLQRVAGASSSMSAVVIDARGERQIFNHRGDALTRASALDTTGWSAATW